MKSKPNYDLLKKYLALCVLLFTISLFIIPHGGFEYDINGWINWSKYIFEHGLDKVYFSDTNYLPLYHYILYVYGLMQGSVQNIEYNIQYLRLISLLFHCITGFFVIRLLKNRSNSWNQSIFNSLFYVLNIAVLYNSLIWAQVDDIMTCFIFISFYYGYRKKILLSLIFLMLAVNFKLQAIIFIPVIMLLILPEIISSYSLKRLLGWIMIPITIQILIVLPFITSGTLGNIYKVIIESFGKYPVISVNAYNIWDIFLSGNLRIRLDSEKFIGLSYKNWGLIAFLSSSLLALLPLLKYSYKSIFKKIDEAITINKLLIISALIPLLFFYLNTQMHERYSHPVFVFLVTFAIIQKKPLLAIIGCLAYFLNQEGCFISTQLINHETLLFNRDFISSLYLITIIWLYILLFDLKSKYILKYLLQWKRIFR